MNTTAYLSSTYFNKIDLKILPITLISYDTVYIDQDFDDLPWEQSGSLSPYSPLFKHYLEKQSETPLIINMAKFVLATYLNFNKQVINLLDSSLRNIRDHPADEIRKFFQLWFAEPLSKGGGSPCFHPTLFPLLFERCKELGYDVENNLQWLIIIVQELFVTHYLQKNHGITPILTTDDIEIRMILKDMPPIPMNPQLPFLPKPLLLTCYYDEATVQDIIQPEQQLIHSSHKKIEILFELAVPDFSDVPILEIAKLKKKDHFSSLSVLIVFPANFSFPTQTEHFTRVCQLVIPNRNKRHFLLYTAGNAEINGKKESSINFNTIIFN